MVSLDELCVETRFQTLHIYAFLSSKPPHAVGANLMPLLQEENRPRNHPVPCPRTLAHGRVEPEPRQSHPESILFLGKAALRKGYWHRPFTITSFVYLIGKTKNSVCRSTRSTGPQREEAVPSSVLTPRAGWLISPTALLEHSTWEAPRPCYR